MKLIETLPPDVAQAVMALADKIGLGESDLTDNQIMDMAASVARGQRAGGRPSLTDFSPTTARFVAYNRGPRDIRGQDGWRGNKAAS